MTKGPGDPEFDQRRAEARARLTDLVGSSGDDASARRTWFEQVYDLADDDPAAVPWADLAPKPVLLDWLAAHPGDGRLAIDVACGLGDNAEAIAAAGYETTAFDLAEGAITWARRRFAHSPVDYHVADLFNLLPEWQARFDFVHETYTIQALQGDLRAAAFSAVASLVRPGGLLLVVCRSREEGQEVVGPPWPLSPGELARFDALGLVRDVEKDFVVEQPDRSIPHRKIVFRKS
ncbi:MAG: class I SAM-dependent methyltransferase [Pseudomonadota bacterium]